MSFAALHAAWARQGIESPLGQLRARALAAPKVTRRGPLTDARGAGLRMLEWGVSEDEEPTPARAKRANPASWITVEALAEQRAALPPLAWERYHCGRWTAREGAAFPPGTWQACVGQPHFEPGESVWYGLDVGGSRADTALTWINEARHVGVEVWEGDEGILHAIDAIRELRGRYRVEALAYDPWRAQQAALELERDGLLCVTWPQTDARACPASESLYRAIIEQRLTLPEHPKLAEHASNCVQRHSRRGWRFDSPSRGANIDSIVALMMALERVEHRPEPVRLVGWL